MRANQDKESLKDIQVGLYNFQKRVNLVNQRSLLCYSENSSLLMNSSFREL